MAEVVEVAAIVFDDPPTTPRIDRRCTSVGRVLSAVSVLDGYLLG